MMKRLRTLIIAVALAIISAISCSACNEGQVETYVSEILFGSEDSSYQNTDKAKMLLNGMYLCCEQHNGFGEDKLSFLHNKGVRGTSSIAKYNIQQQYLLECSHTAWNYQSSAKSDIQKERKRLLQRVVKDTFDFGFYDETFNNGGKQCESFTQFIYYLHILADYLADDPNETSVTVGSQSIISFSGQPYSEVNGNQPNLKVERNSELETYIVYSTPDNGRSGQAVALITEESLPPANSRQQIGSIKPSGWSQNKYPGIVNSNPAYIFNRCHLIAHELGGADEEKNLITGTRYLNVTGMLPWENKVTQYIRDTGNPVLYRSTPIFKGDNLVASGVQLEAYSIPDKGKSLHFNIYCYNVQPGIHINYQTGETYQEDTLISENKVIPFSRKDATKENPDLIFEISRTIAELFSDQQGSGNYQNLQGDIRNIGEVARNSKEYDEQDYKCYENLKQQEYQLLKSLTDNVPLLLKKEPFFNSAFR